MRPTNHNVAKKALLALFCLLLPESAFAHGEEIFLKAFLLLGSLLLSAVLLVLLILSGKLTLAGKAVLTTVFLGATVVEVAIWFSLPYQPGQAPIELLVSILPAASIAVAYAMMRVSQRP